jgi:cation:H+ antiporter
MILLYLLIFLCSCFFLVYSAKFLIDSLLKIGEYLGWKEFVVAFFTISLGAVAPELFIGISSAVNKVPELAFGNILGQNILLFGLTVGICAIILKNGIEVESRTVRAGSTFAVIGAILPLFLILNGELSRIDGAVLLLFFVLFVFWFFSKKERFTKVYENKQDKEKKGAFFVLKKAMILFGGLILIILSSHGIVKSSVIFSEVLGTSLPLIGILIVAAGVGLPETYFSVMLAKKGQSWMILGGLMGSVAISSTLVLGIVALIHPIVIDISQIPSLLTARIFLVLCALFFLFFVRTEKRISTREGILLVSLYAIFVALEIILK